MQNFRKPPQYYNEERNSGSWYERSKLEEMRRNDSFQNKFSSQQSSYGQSSNQSNVLASSYGSDGFFQSQLNNNPRRFGNNQNQASSQIPFDDSFDHRNDDGWTNNSQNYIQPAFSSDSYESRSRQYSHSLTPSQFDDNGAGMIPRSSDTFSKRPSNRASQRFQQFEERFPQNKQYGSDSFNRPPSKQAAQKFRQQFQNKNPQSSGGNQLFYRRQSPDTPNQQFNRAANNQNKAAKRPMSINTGAVYPSEEMDQTEDWNPVMKKMRREYVMMIDPSKFTPTKAQKKQMNMKPMKAFPKQHKCVTCKKSFSSDELLTIHQDTIQHVAMLKSYLKKCILDLHNYSKDLANLITSKEEAAHPAVCGLCDTYNLNPKAHKWSLVHLMRQLDGPGVPLNNKVDPKDFPEEDDVQPNLQGLNYVIPVAGHFCKLCRKICQTKTSHCLSKKHIHFVEKMEERNNPKPEKESTEDKNDDAIKGSKDINDEQLEDAIDEILEEDKDKIPF